MVPEKVSLDDAPPLTAAATSNVDAQEDADSYHSSTDEQFGGFEEAGGAGKEEEEEEEEEGAVKGISVKLDTSLPLGMRLNPMPNGTGILIQAVAPGAQAASTGN